MDNVYPEMGSAVNSPALSSSYNLRVHRVPELPAPLPEGCVRRFTRAFYCRVVLPLAVKHGQAWGRTAKWLTAAEKKFKRICERTFLSYLAELLAAGWIEYQIDDRGIIYINPLYCPPAVDERRTAGPETPSAWIRSSSAATVFASRIAENSPSRFQSSPYRVSGEDIEKEKLTNQKHTGNETPPVGCSLASQKEKENAPCPESENAAVSEPRRTEKANPAHVSVSAHQPPRVSADAGTPPSSTAVPKPVDLPAAASYRIPAAAVQFVEQGKITEAFAASVLASVPSDTLTNAIAATKEREGKGGLRSVAGFLRTAIANRWRPNGASPGNSPNAALNAVSGERSAIPSRFKGYPNIVVEWEKAQRRHLRDIPRERHEGLQERAEKKLAGMNLRYTPDTLCEYMAMAYRFDCEKEGVKS